MNFCSGIHILVKRGDKFLVLRRCDDLEKEPSCWDLPGGTIEFGESPVEAAIRETKEESGLDMKVNQMLGAWAFESEAGYWSIELIAYGVATGGDIKLEDKFSEHQWLSLEEMRELAPKRNHLEALFKESLIDLEKL
jgi:8-oxo-dGTP diphosphatase